MLWHSGCAIGDDRGVAGAESVGGVRHLDVREPGRAPREARDAVAIARSDRLLPRPVAESNFGAGDGRSTARR